MTEQGFSAEQIDTSRPHPARMYDYYLGGWDNYEADRIAAEKVIEAVPEARAGARANRSFLHRAVRFVANQGIDQIIDIGTGIPTSPNTHEVARKVSPGACVAYVDNDPIVATHADARLTNTPGTGFFLADVREPETVLGHPTIRDLIDFGRPVALLLVAVLHFVSDEDDPAGIVTTLTDALPSGSYLVLSHGTADFHPDGLPQVSAVYANATAALSMRSRDRIAPFFDGFDLVEPGLVQIPYWRPDGPDGAVEDPDAAPRIGGYAGVGRKR
ncbi:SAM-dependent methyltransferase [Streptomyces sp. RB6PN25]|uniref:SAM-dependent methyltransferase n=1 Tax=Streptomyces humicola TaxID=2953240 RepID=A0ABT1PXM3_9ACTN|nr:SAM-dependent methyltransferase [Streptomyces humicola]MCQ4082428.1 SAM-dependent methyltransferase [Streptomyces humicola]